MSTFSLDGTSLPSGLQVDTYPVQNNNIPYLHSYTASNAYVAGDFLNHRVPGGQTQSPITGGEVRTTGGDIFYVSVRTRTIFSTAPGTWTGKFFIDDTQEIKFKYLSDPSSISNNGAGDPIPKQRTNQATQARETAIHDTAPAPTGVTTLHEYGFDQTPGRTSFFLDGVLQRNFSDNVPLSLALGCGTTGVQGTLDGARGPHSRKTSYKIKDIVMYYKSNEHDWDTLIV